MNKDFEHFNECFPNSSYRLVYKQYTGDDNKEYQKSKSPMNDVISTYDDIKDTEYRVGWIVPEDYIVVDVDSTSDASLIFTILESCKAEYSLLKSKHGGHFIFKNTDKIGQVVKFPTSLGIKIDTRCLQKGYIILPLNDTDRQWNNISNKIEELPYFLKPLRQKNHFDVDFVAMSDGDGRNSEFYKHFLNLKDYAPELSIEEKINSIKIINKFILQDRLSDNELNKTVLREDVIKKKPSENVVKNDDNKKPRANKTSLEEWAFNICENKQIITCDDVMYMYNGKYYDDVYEKQLEKMIHDECDKNLQEHQRKEVIKFIKLKTVIKSELLNKNWNEIVVKNGILNLKDMKLYPHSSLSYNTIYIDYDYHEVPEYSKTADTFLNQLSNKEPDKRTLLLEVIGYCLLQKCPMGKFFIFCGTGKTGKSTFLNMITNLVGDKNASFLSFNDLEKEYLNVGLRGKLINIGDDINFKGLQDTSMLKKLVVGQKILANRKYLEPVAFKNFATLIFSTNKMPTINDRTTGLYRRMCIINMDCVIEKPDPFFLLNFTDTDYEYLLSKSVEALMNMLKRNSFTENEESIQSLQRFRTEQSSVLMFIKDTDCTRLSLDREPANQVYEEYRNWCKQAGYNPFNKGNFDKELTEELGMLYKHTTKPGDFKEGKLVQKWRYVKN